MNETKQGGDGWEDLWIQLYKDFQACPTAITARLKTLERNLSEVKSKQLAAEYERGKNENLKGSRNRILYEAARKEGYAKAIEELKSRKEDLEKYAKQVEEILSSLTHEKGENGDLREGGK
jgi:flagellar biosynthesis/type III secretory pathway protein FliH